MLDYGRIRPKPLTPKKSFPVPLGKPNLPQFVALGDANDLRTFTPFSPIRGNQVVIVGAALAAPALQTGALLVRESDCSLTQYAVREIAGATRRSWRRSPDADAYLHGLTGYPTTACVFPSGCDEDMLGAGTAIGDSSAARATATCSPLSRATPG